MKDREAISLDTIANDMPLIDRTRYAFRFSFGKQDICVCIAAKSMHESRHAFVAALNRAGFVYNRCPINFVVGGLPLTATITVEGGCRTPGEDARARSLRTLRSRSGATLYQQQSALSFMQGVRYARCVTLSLSFDSLFSFRLYLVVLFLQQTSSDHR